NVLINNAGIMRAEDMLAEPYDLGDAEAMIVTNLLGPIRLTAALLPQLRAQAKAAVLNVTSGLAFVPLAVTPTYSATKAALHSWSDSLRYQLRSTSVQVIEVAPPAVGTDLMPGSRANPNALSLGDYIAETMALLASGPQDAEILVERVRGLRAAQSNPTYAGVFAMLNPAA
ncbi:MAG: SDR family NAD(P)-dependent oxidoreductase, partial [Paracoccaceae bacterium]